jgi:hypothetical protein
MRLLKEEGRGEIKNMQENKRNEKNDKTKNIQKEYCLYVPSVAFTAQQLSSVITWV